MFKLLHEWPPTEWERETVTAQSTVIHSRTKRTALRSGAIIALVVGAVLLGLEWIAQRPSRELRSADALLAEAYSKQRAFELRLRARAEMLDRHYEDAVSTSIATQTLATPTTGKLVFNKYGDEYFLSQIWKAGSNRGNELRKSRREAEVAASTRRGVHSILASQ